jgi:hypothetical protein
MTTDTVDVLIGGWASVSLSRKIEVEPEYDEDGEIDREATLRKVDNKAELQKALDSADSTAIQEQLREDIESHSAEVET